LLLRSFSNPTRTAAKKGKIKEKKSSIKEGRVTEPTLLRRHCLPSRAQHPRHG
jgi:hypothetical protein